MARQKSRSGRRKWTGNFSPEIRLPVRSNRLGSRAKQVKPGSFWQDDDYSGSRSGLAAQSERTSHLRGALPHAWNSKVFVCAEGCFIHYETTSVVMDFEAQVHG